MNKATILVYTSSATRVPHREGGSHEVGIFLGELTEVVGPLISAGHHLVFVSPDGSACTIDSSSYHLIYWQLSSKRLDHAREVLAKLDAMGLRAPVKLSTLLADRPLLDRLDALFIPGGHAPMTDVLHRNWLESDELNAETGELLLHFHQAGKPTALICHGSAALAAAPGINGHWIYEGYAMTCVSRSGEWMAEELPFFNAGGHMPDYPKSILERSGGNVSNVMIGKSLVVEDRELLTGQDPMSAEELGKRFLAKIERFIETR